jgi:hypothetical protein
VVSSRSPRQATGVDVADQEVAYVAQHGTSAVRTGLWAAFGDRDHGLAGLGAPTPFAALARHGEVLDDEAAVVVAHELGTKRRHIEPEDRVVTLDDVDAP